MIYDYGMDQRSDAMALILTFADGRTEAIACPDGKTPDEVMAERGAMLLELCDSLPDAKWKISSSRTGKCFWM